MKVIKIIEEFKKDKASLKILSEIIGKPVSVYYRWNKLYKEQGIPGLKDKASTPKTQPKKLPEFIVSIIESLHKRRPDLTADGIYLYMANSVLLNFIKISKSSIHKIITGKYRNKNAEGETDNNKSDKLQFYNIVTYGIVVCIDFVEIARHKVLFVIDEISRFILGFKIFQQPPTTETVNEYLKKIFKKYKLIQILKSDNGTEFKEKFKRFLDECKVFLLKSPKYYPKFNGKIEYLYKRLRRYLKFIKGVIGEFNLYKILKKFEFSYNYLYGQYVLNKLTPYKAFRKQVLISEGREIIKTEQINNKEIKIKFHNRKGEKSVITLKLCYDGL